MNRRKVQTLLPVPIQEFQRYRAGATTPRRSWTTLLMLPTIGVAMRLMDVSGRRSLLLWTILVLIASLAALMAASVVSMAAAAHAGVATGSVMVYLCCFVMGFVPIPNILCAEIFPTRVRGLCIAVCSLAFWLGDIAVTYSLPVMLRAVGLAGVFGFYAVVYCARSPRPRLYSRVARGVRACLRPRLGHVLAPRRG